MTGRERFLKALAHEEPDRIPIHDAPWIATEERWRAEGLPAGTTPADYFGYEMESASPDTSPRFSPRVMERTEEFIVETTPHGGLRKNFRDYSTTPEIISAPVKSEADWERIKPRLEPDFTRVDWVTARGIADRASAEGRFFAFNAVHGYDAAQGYLMSQDLLVAMAEKPEMVRDIVRTVAKLTIAMAGMMMDNGIQFDGAYLFADMGYRNALLFSPRMYRELLMDVDTMTCEFFHDRGMPVFLHSCGRVKEILPDLIRAGFDCLEPIEVKAGMDLVELKEEYGDRITFMGGIDVRAMADEDPHVIEEEIATKVPVAMKDGGYIYHSDHSIPKNVSFQQYVYVMELVRKYGTY